jgi:hypothetical protein
MNYIDLSPELLRWGFFLKELCTWNIAGIFFREGKPEPVSAVENHE